MNIIFEQIKWKNFLSYGEDFTEFDFKQGLDLIVGKNGRGKSSLNDALFYALFGKPFRKIKLGSLINDTNLKKLEVELYFNINAKSYKIVRGMKPDKFEIYLKKDNEYVMFEQKAGMKDYQKFLEEEILNINETIFRQLIVLGANLPSSKPFMELSQTEKESLFQVLTDTSIFNYLKMNIKTRLADIKTQLKELDYRREITKTSLDSEKLMVEQAEKQNAEFYEAHNKNIKLTEETITNAKNNITKYKEGLVKIKSLKEKYDEDISILNSMKSSLNEAIEKNKRDINEIRDKILLNYNNEIEEIDKEYTLHSYSELENEIEELRNEEHQINNKIERLTNKIELIDASTKSAIKCKSCSTVNYLTKLDESEIKNKKKYVLIKEELYNRQHELKDIIKESISNIARVKSEDLKKNIHKKEESLNRKQQAELNLKRKNDSFMESITKTSQNINKLTDRTNKYKEKLLNAKRLKELLEDEEARLEYQNTKLLELQNIKIIDVDYSTLKNKEVEYSALLENIKEIKLTSDNLINLDNLIGANNLKGMVIKKQIPFLNKGINHFLELFSMLDYSFVINENFKERIISRTKDAEFNQLSNGQKSRISFSIMFAFLRLIEDRNGVRTNILILDEILDSSVDASGREELLHILKTEFSDHKDIVIISHNQEIKEKIELFDRLIHIKKDKYSSLIIEDI